MKKIYLCVVASLTLSFASIGQIVNVGNPISFKGKVSSEVESVSMPSFDLRQTMLEDSINDSNKVGPWRFAYLHNVNLGLDNAGSWTELPNGGSLWRLNIKSDGALSLNLVMDKFYIPEGAHVHIYSEDRSQVIGAYTSRNNNEERVFGTELIIGESMVIEYFEPKEVLGEGELNIEYVAHGYRSLSLYADNLIDEYKDERGYDDAGACNIDALCTNFASPTSSWVDQINSVAMIVSGGNGVCTGTLVNNTCENGTPYFLTADHCLGGSNAPSTLTWAFRFNWQRPSSGALDCPTGSGTNPGNTYDQTAYGATIRANSGNSDFALLEISNMTLTDAQSYGAVYAGWDNTDNAVNSAIGIHHPSGDIKKKCLENNALTKTTWGGAACWQVANWDEGVTEPGSSGSALFDMNGRLIGQLYGGSAACSGTNDNNAPDYYGRFATSWDAVSGNNNSLENWLDGDNGACPATGATVIDAYNPNANPVADNAGISTVIAPTGSICGGTISAEVTLRNYGTNNLTSVDIIYDVDGSGAQTFNWSGTLSPGQTTNVNLGNVTASSGVHTFNAATSNPNGTTDNDMSNDAASAQFNYIANPATINVDIVLDDYGSETTWEITDGATVIASGGAYQDNMDQTLESTQVCLEEGECYTFTIFDDFGDGICCDYGNGSYTVSWPAESMTLASGGQFANSEATNFCLTTPVGVNEISDGQVLIYPNPSNGNINLRGIGISDLVDIKVYDATGKLVNVYSNMNITNGVNIELALSKGVYLISVISDDNKIVKRIVID